MTHAAHEPPGMALIAEQLPSIEPTTDHARLLGFLRSQPGWERAKVAACRSEGWSRAKRKVLSASGEVLHEDHREWLGDQVARDGGDAAATHARLRDQGLTLAECRLTSLHIVQDRGGARADDFVQLDIWIEDEFVVRELLGEPWGAVRDLDDLIDYAGAELPQPVRMRPPTYALSGALDVARFVDELDALDRERRAAQAKQLVRLTDSFTGESEVKPLGALHPDLTRFPSRARRLFDDWTYSSAGRLGARFCDHWILSTWYDRPASDGTRHMHLVPGWTFKGKLAAVERASSDYDLMAKLQRLEARVKVPFGWYFFMLHGNRVKDWAGHRVLGAAESGRIVLPEHDYRVLKAWEASPYGF